MSQHDEVEPTRPAAATSNRSELFADVDDRLPTLVGQLGREWTRSYACRICLGNPDDARNVSRTQTGANSCATGDRMRRGHVGIGPVVNIEKRRLRTLEQDFVPVGECIVQHVHRVGDVGGKSSGECGERFDDVIDIDRLTPSCDE